MSWLAKLYETYDNIEKFEKHNDQNLLWPTSHFLKNTHLEVVIDIDGNFLNGRSRILTGNESPTLIPASEASAGRAGSKIAPHPLCEEVGYCATDRPNANQEKVSAYMEQLREWTQSKWSHPKINAVLKYLEKKTLWKDLTREIEFPVKVKKVNGATENKIDEKVFLRWRVEEPGIPGGATWNDDTLIQAWIGFDAERNSKEGFCYVQGRSLRRASNHPRFLRWPGDGAKLISSNDHSGFTFRGRFTDSKTTIDKNGTQAVIVSFDVSQKAHNALRWLLGSHKCFHNEDQVYVSWAVSCKETPEPLAASWDLFTADFTIHENIGEEQETGVDHTIDLGSSFAYDLKKYMAGYHAKLKPNEQIVIMGLDAATPGRMGIIYYRELLASEFLNRIELWHGQFAWFQRYTQELHDPKGKKKSTRKTIWPLSSPAPRVIAEAAYGDILKSNDTLKKSVIERIMPCIVDGRAFPRDLMMLAVRRASNRVVKRLPEQFSNLKTEKAAWEKHLGVACALFKGFCLRHPDKNKRREYAMALEEERTTRDYLYGRLLAIAERIEEMALRVGNEDRPTNAARLMQRFADRPFSTWRNIFLGLQPYMQRLQSSRAGFLVNRKKELDAVLAAFEPGDFISDKALSGEFLLGYHCQRQAWHQTTSDENSEE